MPVEHLLTNIVQNQIIRVEVRCGIICNADQKVNKFTHKQT